MEKMKKQTKISNSLKLLDFVFAVFVIAFFGGLIVVKYNHAGLLSSDFDSLLDNSLVIASGISIVVGLLILWFFLKVCNEIGRDNSFSLENVANLHNMAVLGVLFSIIYAVREVAQLIIATHSAFTLGYNFIMIFLGLAFMGVCECMSRLVKTAYEIKLENELTI